jgi:hypothetical protein
MTDIKHLKELAERLENYRLDDPLAQKAAEAILALCERAEKLEAALKRLVERIDANGGLGEYQGGPVFVMIEARALLTKEPTP